MLPTANVISGPIALINPNNIPKNQNSQHCRYARLQPVYCQLIVLTSNILSLAKSLIGIGTVMVDTMSIIFYISEATCFSGKVINT